MSDSQSPQSPASGTAPDVAAVALGSAQLVVRLHHDPFKGWRLIYRHRNEMVPLPTGGLEMKMVPDDTAYHFTTIATCSDEAWARRILESLSLPNNSGQTRPAKSL